MPKTNVFGHIRASVQFGPKSQNAETECFWAHSGCRPIWSKPGATHQPTHPPIRAPPIHPTTHPGATHPPTQPPRLHESFWAPSGFSPIWSQPVATHPPTHLPSRAPPGRHPPPGATHPPTHPPTHPGATNLFGHIRASAQFGPNSRNAKNKCFWAHSAFSPIWSEQRESRKGTFLGTFRLRPNSVRTARMLKSSVFGHIRASGHFGPNRAPPTHPPTHPPTRAPPTHPPTHPPGRHESFWAHSGFSPIWSQQPECRIRTFLGTLGLQPNLVRTAGMPNTNVFGHIRASGQFGPNRAPPTHPPTHPTGRHPPTHPPTRAPRIFLGTFGLQPNLVGIARMPNKNVFAHIQASAQNGPNSQNAEYRCFWAHSGFSPLWSE